MSEEKLDILLSRTEKIERGLYGDEDNGVKGLIKDSEDQDERIKKLEKSKWKERGIIGGLIMAWTYLKDF